MLSSELSKSLLTDAQHYLSKRFGGVDLSAMTLADITPMIEKTFPGGWTAFEYDFVTHSRHLQSAAKTEALSPVKLKIKVEHFLGRKLRDYDRIESATFTDTTAKIVVSIATVTQRSRSDLITTRTLELHDFIRTNPTAIWKHRTIDMEESVQEGHVRYGKVMTPERHEDIADQYETCHRPGTETSPMLGWIARAEISHRQAHAADTFQSPSK